MSLFLGCDSIHGGVLRGVRRGGARRAAQAAAAAHLLPGARCGTRGTRAARAALRAAAPDMNMPLYAMIGDVCTASPRFFPVLNQV